MADEPESGSQSAFPGRHVRTVIVTAGFIVAGYSLVRLLLTFGYDSFWRPQLGAQLPAMAGVPLAALVALCIVIVLENTSGHIEMEGPLGFKFKGASGPVILWICCFLAIVGAIKLTWAY